MSQRLNPQMIGIIWMLITGALFVGVTVVVKHLGSGLPAAEAAFLRYAIGLVFVLPVVPALLRHRPDAPALRLYALRGAAHTFGVTLWFYAMSRIPIAEVTAMNYLAPVYVMIGAALFLGDRMSKRRIVAVGVALVGTLIILRPGFREITSGHFAMLGAGLLLGASYLIAKRDIGACAVCLGGLGAANRARADVDFAGRAVGHKWALYDGHGVPGGAA